MTPVFASSGPRRAGRGFARRPGPPAVAFSSAGCRGVRAVYGADFHHLIRIVAGRRVRAGVRRIARVRAGVRRIAGDATVGAAVTLRGGRTGPATVNPQVIPEVGILQNPGRFLQVAVRLISLRPAPSPLEHCVLRLARAHFAGRIGPLNAIYCIVGLGDKRAARRREAPARRRPAFRRGAQSPSGRVNTNRLLPALGRSSGVRRMKPDAVAAEPVLTATYWRPPAA